MGDPRRIIRQKFKTKQDSLRGDPGRLGNESGVVAVPDRPNYVYVRMAGQPISEVYNTRVPLIHDLPVLVGHDPIQPKLYQVLTIHSAGGDIAQLYSGLTPHAETHRFLGPGTAGGTDPVNLELENFLPLRITPAGGLLINVYRGWVWSGSEWMLIQPTESVDLEEYEPDTEDYALLVLVTIDTSGAIVLTPGSEVAIADLEPSDIPEAPENTAFTCGAVRRYYGQQAIYQARTVNDIVDLRFPGMGGVGGGGGGDMLKSIYDTDDNGIVDEAESVPWSGVTDPPATYAPSAHEHVEADITDLDHTDADAIHDNVSGEINAITEKETPDDDDVLLIEDSEASYAKKYVKISNLPGGVGGPDPYDLDPEANGVADPGISDDYSRGDHIHPAGEGDGDMTKAVYDTDDDGVVDEAAAIEGVDAAGNSKYYGTNSGGTPGFYSLPEGGGGATDILQVQVFS